MGEKNISEVVPDVEFFKKKIQAILINILQCMLKYPEKMSVEIEQGERTTLFIVDVDKVDFGRLVGSRGKNIESLRTIVQSISGSQGFRAILQIKDEERFF
ncbi:hypothetical protein AZI86_10755 [Bdellovibrio bacteriovorus]|uniref:Uncharacterized protein n=1 Tax=Bdellovibrio bacteriovorus TaxID=959 RepID=A0A150WLV5_BDEBC|nr:KH domain-containing protein [Bdellovibrio bacteriovorus]KYG64683.1 hypothetical protein AZI86_10755 [Bdellovibrio bacteriovorus]